MSSSTDEGRGPFWYHGWNVVGACVLAQFAVNGLTVNAFSLFLRDWQSDLHAPVSTFQLGFSLFGLVTALLSPLAGVYADKYPTRVLFGVGLALQALICLAMGFVTGAWQVLAIYALPVSLVACLCSLIPANAVVSRWFTRRIGLALGLTALGQGLPGVILPPIVAALLPSLGWRTVWRIAAAVTAIVVLPLVVAVLRDRPTERDGLDYLAGRAAAPSHHGHGAPGAGWREFMTRRNFWVLVLIFLSLLAAFIGANANLTPIVIARGLGEKTAGILLSTFSFSQLVATLVSGLLSDRFGNRLPLVGLTFASAAGSLLLAFGGSLAVIAPAVALIGFSAGFWPLLAAAVAVEFGAERAGRAFGLVSAFLPAVVLAPFLMAKTQELTGSYAPGLLTVSLFAFIGGLAGLFLLRERSGGHATGAEHLAAEHIAKPVT